MDLPDFIMNSMPVESATTVILRQPAKRGYRFRYASEGATHGGIQAEGSTKTNKIAPAIQLLNHTGPAKVVLTLVTSGKHNEQYLHPHTLIVNKNRTPGYHIFDIPSGNPILELPGIAIQHAKKENVKEILTQRILCTRFINDFGWNSGLNNGIGADDISYFVNSIQTHENNENACRFVNPSTSQLLTDFELHNLRKEAERIKKKIKMNEVRFCFQAFLQDESGKYRRVLDPIYSESIIDGKTKGGSPLKIERLSKVSCSVDGDEEVWIVADKIDATDIEVRVFETIDGQTVAWEGFGSFNKTDVLHQHVLVFRTPAYHDLKIMQPVSVFIQLRRKKDLSSSEPMPFKYTPKNYDQYGIGKKRKKRLPSFETLPQPQDLPSTSTGSTQASQDYNWNRLLIENHNLLTNIDVANLNQSFANPNQSFANPNQGFTNLNQGVANLNQGVNVNFTASAMDDQIKFFKQEGKLDSTNLNQGVANLNPSVNVNFASSAIDDQTKNLKQEERLGFDQNEKPVTSFSELFSTFPTENHFETLPTTENMIGFGTAGNEAQRGFSVLLELDDKKNNFYDDTITP